MATFTGTYVRRELGRRKGRTILTVLGLSLGVGLVAAITSISSGLDHAQAGVLDPLSSIGTDLMATRSIEPRAEGPGLSAADRDALIAENAASVVTDLSTLGDPGDRFERDFFMPATQLTFPVEQAADVAALTGVADVALGLTLTAVHQEGTIPEIVVEFETGGDVFRGVAAVEPPSREELDKIRACQEDARSEEARQACLPQREFVFRSPRETIRQQLDAPQTDITSTTYTIAGVDLTTRDLGLITPAQITDGSFLTAGDQAVVAEAYAQREGLEVGDTLTINKRRLTVVGLAKPPLGGQTADVYVSLTRLQKMSGRHGRANVMLVRVDDAANVASTSQAIEEAMPGARVSNAEDLAERVSGSLVDAANLADRLGLILSMTLLVAAFLIATLLTLSSIAKRVREFGTLKAIGWRTGRVVRQVLAESAAQGILGGVLGIGLGIAVAAAIAALAPPLQATASAPNVGPFAAAATPLAETIALTAPIEVSTIALALGLALAGGLLAGGAGALRVARLRPSDAMRVVG